MEKKEICPHCGTTVAVNFDHGDELASGKHVVCAYCNLLIWIPVGNYKPTGFYHSTDQNGRPRELRA